MYYSGKDDRLPLACQSDPRIQKRIRPGTVIYSGLKFVSLTPPSRLRRIADRRNNDTIRWILNHQQFIFLHGPYTVNRTKSDYVLPRTRIAPSPKNRPRTKIQKLCQDSPISGLMTAEPRILYIGNFTCKYYIQMLYVSCHTSFFSCRLYTFGITNISV